jgi:hypothetical protein
VTGLADKLLALHHSLSDADLPHAFGGALALAWCTRQPRGTSDIDVNVFVPVSALRSALDGLPDTVSWDRRAEGELARDGQARLWWDATPVDLFLNTTPFHEAAMGRTRLEPFDGEMVPFLGCADLAVFKAFFDRRRDWADLEDMLVAGSVDGDAVAEVVEGLLGRDDERVARLRALTAEVQRT